MVHDGPTGILDALWRQGDEVGCSQEGSVHGRNDSICYSALRTRELRTYRATTKTEKL